MGLFDKVKDYMMIGNEYDDEDELEEMEARIEAIVPRNRQMGPTPLHQNKLVSINGANMPKMELLNFTMLTYDMTWEVFSYVKNKKPVVVNMQQLEAHEVQRAVDCLTGACYALNGTVDTVAKNIYIFAPEDVNVSAENIKEKKPWPV